MSSNLKFKKNIVFKYDSKEHFFFQIINFGKNDEDEFKFIFSNPDGGTGNIYMDEGLKMDEDSIITSYGELTYHKDGSLLHKFPEYQIESRKYINPEGAGYRRTPTAEIEDWEPILLYNIFDYNLCRLNTELPNELKYIIEDYDLIDRGLPFFSSVNLIRDSFSLPKIHFEGLEKNIVINDVGENLHLWILLSRATEGGFWIEMENGEKVFSRNNQMKIVERK